MQIYKFGGASVKDANGVKNLVQILQKEGFTDKLIVISAMGKTTNALEDVVREYFGTREKLDYYIDVVKDFHYKIINELFENQKAPIYDKIRELFEELTSFLEKNKSPQHSFVYDQVVGFGELISTNIISEYLNLLGIENTWIDVRSLIKTDDNYRDATIVWDETLKNVQNKIKSTQLYITQGFLGSDSNYFTTTLGREGSDYSAAILAYCLSAQSITIWKDVSGVLNADPRYFSQTKLLRKIPYREAIELAFYGASVIHPKTLQPLQRKEIPLYVRSFINSDEQGSVVCDVEELEPKVPCFILKQNQHLIHLSSLDFSFIGEDNISYIFNLLSKYQTKMSIIQNSAIGFSLCVDNKFGNLEILLEDLKMKFHVECIKEVNLYTIRHADQFSIESVEKGKEILLKQSLQNVVQIVTK